MRMLSMSLLLSLGLASLGPATAGPLEDGFAAYQAGDYTEALRIFEQEPEQDNAYAQNNLGFRACCRIGASAIGIPLRLAVSRLTVLGLRDSVCVSFH